MQIKPEMSGHTEGNLQHDLPKEENEEDDEDEDDMLDTDDLGGPPRTEAERRAERRKMKRFRQVEFELMLIEISLTITVLHTSKHGF